MEQRDLTTKSGRITGWVLSGLVLLFLGFDVLGKVTRPEAVIQGVTELGYPTSSILLIGLILLTCTALYAVPRTALLGAVLLTGYLGGAVATHVRVGNPLFSHTLFPVYMGILLWLGLYLRSTKLRRITQS